MPTLMFECQNCHKMISSGLDLGEGSTVTLENNRSQCRYCNSIASIPNGTFMVTVNGLIDLLKDSKNPLKDAKEILNELEKGNISKVPQRDKIEKFLGNNERKIAVAVVVLKILIDLLSKEPNIQINNNILNQNFYSQYNQYIEINQK